MKMDGELERPKSVIPFSVDVSVRAHTQFSTLFTQVQMN